MNIGKKILFFAGVVLLGALSLYAADDPQVQLNIASAGPRAVEDATQQRILRDYAAAWKTLSAALDQNSSQGLGAYFVGGAKDQYTSAIADQQRNGLRTRYLSQKHDLNAVFYAPEGDVLQLRDTVTCQMQVMDGDKVIHDEQVVLHYVVLMTPGADRWVVRQLQSVREF